jgi:S1-C subfamily serine protease
MRISRRQLKIRRRQSDQVPMPVPVTTLKQTTTLASSSPSISSTQKKSTNEQHPPSRPRNSHIISSEMYSNIVRIISHTTDFDYTMPFKINGMSTVTGTGFFINLKGCILTCAHVVSNATHVYIEIPSEGKRQYVAQIMGVCPFFDLAILKVDDYKNKTYCELDTRLMDASLESADIIQSGAEAYALGFPLGQDNLKVTKGIISGQQLRMYQIDTPINPGNSGGPLLMNNKVIGVNGAGMMLANNIGYAVPISRYFMIEAELHKYHTLIHFPEVLGCEYQRTSDDFIRFFGHGSGKASGVYLKRLFKGSLLANSPLKKTDILHSVNGNVLDNYGEFDKKWMMQKMTLTNMLCTLKLGEAVRVGYFPMPQKQRDEFIHEIADSDCECDSDNDGDDADSIQPSPTVATGEVHYAECMMNTEYKMPIRRMYSLFEDIDYEVIGGIVVMPLTLNHFEEGAYNSALLKYRHMKNRHSSRLVISCVLMGSHLATLKTLRSKDIIRHVNGHRVRTVAEFRKYIVDTKERDGEHFVEIYTETQNIALLPVSKIVEEEAEMQRIYKYTPTKYNLLDTLKAKLL